MRKYHPFAEESHPPPLTRNAVDVIEAIAPLNVEVRSFPIHITYFIYDLANPVHSPSPSLTLLLQLKPRMSNFISYTPYLRITCWNRSCIAASNHTSQINMMLEQIACSAVMTQSISQQSIKLQLMQTQEVPTSHIPLTKF